MTTMQTTITTTLLIFLSLTTASTTPTRRNLHQPFFPLDSSPPQQSSPTLSPPTQPFSGPTTPDQPFFPTDPTPPPAPTVPNPSPFASFPANISSLILPHSPSSPKPVSKKLVAVTIALSLSAAIIAAVALFFYFNGRCKSKRRSLNDDKTSTTTNATIATTNTALPPRPPPLRKSSNTSSEFLYLGTLANNNATLGGGGGRGSSGARAGGGRKMDSPELHPLPPLLGRQQQHQQQHRLSYEYHHRQPQQQQQQQQIYHHNDVATTAAQYNNNRNTRQEQEFEEENNQDEFYSPRGSESGGSRSNSRRVPFESVVRAQQAQLTPHHQDHFTTSNAAHSDVETTSSSSSSSSSGSPARSASISISPAASNSPKNVSNPKSSPEYIEMQVQQLNQSHNQHSHPSPPLPEMCFASPPYSLTSSPERAMSTIKEEEEREESPLLSNASSSSRMTSPMLSPKMSPKRVGDEEREWGVLGRASPSLSAASSPGRKSPSVVAAALKLPAFLGGGKRRESNSSKTNSLTSLSALNSPVSPHSPPSPLSSSGSSSRKSRSYPASPLSNSPRLSDASPRASNANEQRIQAQLPVAPPPPPPPPPPAMRRSHSPPPPPVAPQSKRESVGESVGFVTPVKPVVVEKVGESSGSVERASEGSEETTPRPKLKPLHWDKVRASSDREMVWDQLRSSSFKLNEEMIESLFVVNNNPNQKGTPNKPFMPLPGQENRVLDPKKAQNIAILLRALNVTMEEVCEALLEGNSETLGTELLESLLKMAPTKEEERRLKEYKDDSPVKLGHAEKFLKAVIDIPYAFRRVEAMLYAANFESEIEYLNKSFETLEVACDELRSSRMFFKLLEAVLKTGNRMNVGTNRGDAHAFKLDTLLKLVDVKGADGKTTLLHFVVQEIIRTEGQRLSTANNQASNDEAKCRKLGLQVVSCLSSELTNVKKAAVMDSDVLSNDVAKLTLGLANIGEVVRLIEQTHLQESSRNFSESMNKFMKLAEEEIYKVQARERVGLSLVKEITEYFHGNTAKEEAHPFRIFQVVRDFLATLDRVCKEVAMVNERTIVSSAHRFPVPVNPMLPVPVNPLLPQVLPGFPGKRQSSFSDDGSP